MERREPTCACGEHHSDSGKQADARGLEPSPDGRWIERIVSTNNGSAYYPAFTNRFIWDGQVLMAILNHTNGLVMSFVRGLDLSGSIQGAGGVGGVLAVNFAPSTLIPQPSTHFLCYDGNGNVVALTGTNGTISGQFEYGPFSEPIRVTGTAAQQMPLRFSTMYEDSVTGDSKYLFRDLNPSTGRWKSRDPIEEDSSYRFTWNDCLSGYDVLGLWGKEVHLTRTTEWARGVGIAQRIANLIGRADNDIDSIQYPGKINDLAWSWHFNRASTGDSRLTHRDQMVRFAEFACRSNIDDPEDAARYLGWALHPDQDWVAHGDYNRRQEAPTLTGVRGLEKLYYWHNFGLGAVGNGSTEMPDGPNLDADGSTDHGRATIQAMSGPRGSHRRLSNGDIVYWVSYHRGNQRINLTQERTEELLARFQYYVLAEGGCRCLMAFVGGR